MTKLEQRRKEYGIPAVPCLPQGKKVIVYRLPLEDETRTAGGLIVPQSHANPNPRGVLIAAGLLARDKMRDALIEIGDIVWLPQFATNTPEVEREAAKAGKHVVMINIEDIVGSVDGVERLDREYDIVFDEEESNQHHYVKRGEKPKAIKRKAA